VVDPNSTAIATYLIVTHTIAQNFARRPTSHHLRMGAKLRPQGLQHHRVLQAFPRTKKGNELSIGGGGVELVYSSEDQRIMAEWIMK
jgi:hypothetical protein